MRILIITQNDPFYLYEPINYFLNNLPTYADIIGAIILKPSPYGKKESYFKKAYKLLNIFGLKLSIYLGIKFFINKIKKKTAYHAFKRNGIEIIKLKNRLNSPESINLIKKCAPDLIISISANEIFKKDLIKIPSKGCINLHSALLPKYRGLMPTFWALKNGEKEAGISVFFIDEGIDSGPILIQKKVILDEKTTLESLIKKTKRIGMDALIEAIQIIYKGNYNLIPNDERDMTYYSFPKKQDVIEFKKLGRRFY